MCSYGVLLLKVLVNVFRELFRLSKFKNIAITLRYTFYLLLSWYDCVPTIAKSPSNDTLIRGA